mmetsp:Transcript_14779/g.21306  ORF Transcript_14779/g.21306 Transcript_14779/m.21306 type:complete len:83 (+) Transcript_14779:493-741(+)
MTTVTDADERGPPSGSDKEEEEVFDEEENNVSVIMTDYNMDRTGELGRPKFGFTISCGGQRGGFGWTGSSLCLLLLVVLIYS